VHTPGAARSVPASQPPLAMHVDWFIVVVVVPTAHGAHWRSAVVLPVVLT
jgi:hypothetical protein